MSVQKQKTIFVHNNCTQHNNFSGNSMNNLLSYCGLTDARMRASEKDLPVILQILKNIQEQNVHNAKIYGKNFRKFVRIEIKDA